MSNRKEIGKYGSCMLCPETRYIQKHHIDGKKADEGTQRRTIPLCPICHIAITRGDLKFDNLDELWNAYKVWAGKGFAMNEKPFGNIWEGKR